MSCGASFGLEANLASSTLKVGERARRSSSAMYFRSIDKYILLEAVKKWLGNATKSDIQG